MASCFVIPKQEIEKTLAQEPCQGKRALEPLFSLLAEKGVPARVLEDYAMSSGQAELHWKEADLFLCLQGEAFFQYGGELVDPSLLRTPDGQELSDHLVAREIQGGDTAVLREGDWIWIPAGQPHLHYAEDLCRLLVVKVPNEQQFN